MVVKIKKHILRKTQLTTPNFLWAIYWWYWNTSGDLSWGSSHIKIAETCDFYHLFTLHWRRTYGFQVLVIFKNYFRLSKLNIIAIFIGSVFSKRYIGWYSNLWLGMPRLVRRIRLCRFGWSQTPIKGWMTKINKSSTKNNVWVSK